MNANQVRTTLLAMLLALGKAPAALAGSFDGKQNLVCSTVDVVGCTDGSTCLHGHARDFELPDFVFVDFGKGLLRAPMHSGSKETSPIRSSEASKHQLVLQGFENHQGWTLAIDRADGQMTLTSTGRDVSFMVFGACTAL
jgi:hypothetical protein